MSSGSAILYKTRCESAAGWRLLKHQPWLKLVFILAFAILCEGGLWALFYEGFRFMGTLGGIGTMLITRLFSLFFFAMGTMLTLSSIITSYSSFFRTDEIPYLVTSPIPINELVLYRFVDAAFLSSWSFGFIVIPFLGAYAMYQHLSPVFAVWTILFSIPFLFCCCGVGTTLAMFSIRWAPIGRALKLVLSIAILALLGYGWFVTRDINDPNNDIQVNMVRLVPGLNMASYPLLPSRWVAEGMLALQNGDLIRGGMLWLCTATTGLVMALLVERLGCLLFYPAWLRVTGSSTRIRRTAVLLPWLETVTGFLPPEIRGLLAKDIRTFFRDPMQWSQTLVFFGLLGLYFSNLRHFHYDLMSDVWRNFITFINVFSVSSVMCSLSSRFVFPQLSLEGQGFWTIGLSPLTLRRVLLAKFGLSVVALETVSIGLMYLSTTMLHANPETRAVAILLASSVALTVSALSIGLGAVFMDLNQRNPAAIVSGFGGTLNLVLSLTFMLGVIFPFALVHHQHIMGHFPGATFTRVLIGVSLWTLLLTAAFTLIPLHLGIRSLERREF